MFKYPKNVCCRDMSDAMRPCSDHEGMSSLFSYDGYEFYATYLLPRLNFCPWCGKKLLTNEAK